MTTLSFAKARPERVVLFDHDWLFFRGPGAGGDQPAKDEAGWKPVDLPHDWSIEDLPGTHSPFHPEALSGVSGGFTTGGLGWYRKTFTVPASQRHKRIFIQFDGVYMNAEVWLNGHRLGNWPYGYSSFWFDLTDKIRPGQEQELVVKVRNEGKNSRWYSGSGIYRHVWLKVTDAVHVAQWGTYITTPQVSAAAARVAIKTSVQNQSAEPQQVELSTTLLDQQGRKAGTATSTQRLEAGATLEFSQQVQVTAPQLWSVDKPALYTAVAEVRAGSYRDREQTTFGIRSIAFDAVNGFRLNGQ